MEQDIDKVARALRTDPFVSMLAADRELYEKCLDTPGFAYAFGHAATVCKYAPAMIAEVKRLRALLAPAPAWTRETFPGTVPPREILASTGLGETVSTPTQLDIRITLDPGPEGQAIAAEIRAVLERARVRESACVHDWVTQYGFGCTPGSTRDTTFCSRCGARRAQSPAPAWTREAPKEPGWYFVRHVADRERRFFAAYYTEGVWSRASGPVEHWPVPIPEPPK